MKQERIKLAALVEKREIKRGLQQLRRKWKGHQQLKLLLDYLLNLHSKLEELQKSESIHVSNEKQLREGVITITNYVKGGLEEIRQSSSFTQSRMSIHVRDSTLRQLMTSVERAYNYLFESHQEHQNLIQSEVKLSVQSSVISQPQSARRISQKKQTKTPPSSYLQRKSNKFDRTPKDTDRSSKDKESEEKHIHWRKSVERLSLIHI